MTQNPEIVRRTIDGWNRDDLDSVLEMLHPEVEFHTSGVFPDFDALYRGREGYARFWRAMHEPWEELRLSIERIEDGEDCVAVEFRFHAKGVGSGAPVDLKVETRSHCATDSRQGSSLVGSSRMHS